METTSIITPSTTTVAFIPANAVTDIHCKDRLALGNLQKNPILKVKNNF
jgi:hypothetical protein